MCGSERFESQGGGIVNSGGGILWEFSLSGG
jgi:hypothetical protein